MPQMRLICGLYYLASNCQLVLAYFDTISDLLDKQLLDFVLKVRLLRLNFFLQLIIPRASFETDLAEYRLNRKTSAHSYSAGLFNT